MARESDGIGSGLDPASKGAGCGNEIRPSGKENSIDLGSSRLKGGDVGNVAGKRTEDKTWYEKGAGKKYTKL